MHSHDVLVVADDRSGACDAGHQFAARGHETVVVGRGDAAAADVGVVDTDSRYVDAATAASRVREAVAARPGTVTYKKIDSTLRGNVVAEVDAVVAETGADVAVVAPAFPAENRVTVGGYHLVDGTPVAETAAGADPDKPVTTSHLPTRFAESAYNVHHLPVDAAGDQSAVAERVADCRTGDAPAIVTCDAATEDHLAAIASGVAGSSLHVVYVGSAGLARHVPVGSGDRSVLGIVGSASPQTFEQLDALPESRVVTADGPALVTDRDATISTTAEDAVATLDTGGSVVVTAAESRADVEATLGAADDAGVSGTDAREQVASGLGAVAARVADEASPAGLLLSGGAVAAVTLSALDASGVTLTGRSVDAGVPVGRVVDGTMAGRPVVTKAGAFGDSGTIVNCLDSLAAYDE